MALAILCQAISGVIFVKCIGCWSYYPAHVFEVAGSGLHPVGASVFLFVLCDFTYSYQIWYHYYFDALFVGALKKFSNVFCEYLTAIQEIHSIWFRSDGISRRSD